MRKYIFTIILMGCGLAALAAGEQRHPGLNVLFTALDMRVSPQENKLEATARIRFALRDKTNYAAFRLNGNLAVESVQAADGAELRFVQDSGEKALVIVHLGEQVEPGAEREIRIRYAGVFASSGFDFNQAVGMESRAQLSEDRVELFPTSFWYPASIDVMDRSQYDLRILLPEAWAAFTVGTPLENPDAGETLLQARPGEKVRQFRTGRESLPPSLVAGRFRLSERKTADGGVIRFALRTEFAAEDAALGRVAAAATAVDGLIPYIPWPGNLTVVETGDDAQDVGGMEGIVLLRKKDFGEGHARVREQLRRLALQKWLFQVRFAEAGDLWIPEGLARLAAAQLGDPKGGEAALASDMRLSAIDALRYAETETVQKGARFGQGSEKYLSVVVSKGAWIHYMLQTVMGPQPFRKLLETAAAKGRQEPLGSADWARLASAAAGHDLGWFFPQWVEGVQLPRLSTEYIIERFSKGGYQAAGKIMQQGAFFTLPLELRIDLKDSSKGAERQTLQTGGAVTRFCYPVKERPLRIELDPDYRILRKSKDIEIDVHFTRGDEAFESGDNESAVEFYKKAVELENRNSLAFYKMAMVFFSQGNYNAALDTFRDALNGNGRPEWVIASSFLMVGKCYDLLGQRERAVAEYNKALNTKDDSRGAVTEAGKLVKDPFVLPGGTPAAAAGEEKGKADKEEGPPKKGEAGKTGEGK